ncbi:hypothetical protein P9K31_12910 [Corynebacterium glutamicum]|uniref:hypothetical protein n=1 Tax=Corynebacterium TaxID=1716 RepID=UPI0012DB28AC|nr:MULTISPECIES: hypothetical protein [Corynebacterium]WFP71327.1 hypothetical protein P9K31_12910 [Corynebacterium glutamicum]
MSTRERTLQLKLISGLGADCRQYERTITFEALSSGGSPPFSGDLISETTP